jgi:autotransporter-associated beta strand protein
LGANSNFSTANNWTPAAIPANDGTANLVFSGSTRLTPTIDAPWSVNSLSYGNLAGAFSIGGQALTLGAGGITLQQRGPIEIISAPIVLAASQTWADLTSPLGDGIWVKNTINLNGFDLTLTSNSNGDGNPLDGAIFGVGNITITGGQFGSRTDNSFLGSVNFDGGVFQVSTSGGLSSSNTPLNFNGGTLAIGASSATTFPQNGFIADGGATLASGVSQNVATTFAGKFTGPGSLTIETAGGTIKLTGANTYSGGTIIAPNSVLEVTTASLPGNVSLDDPTHGFAVLQFRQDVNGGYSGAIDGFGTIKKNGTGALSFGGTITANATKLIGLLVSDGKFIMTGGSNAFSGVSLDALGGTFDLNGTNQVIADLTGTVGTIALTNGVLTFGRDNGSVFFSGSLTGNGGITKTGTCTQTLAGVNSYTGVTRVEVGTLVAQTSLSANGSGKVYLTAGTTFGSAEIILPIRGTAAGFGSTATGTSPGLLGSAADIRAGQVHGTIATNLDMQWRVRMPNESFSGQPISDVLNLDGLALTTNQGTHLQSDPYVLQMSYSTNTLGSETAAAGNGLIYVAWLNSSGQWQNAATANFGSGLAGDVFLDVQSSWDAFASIHQITDANVGNFLGSYGVDTAKHQVWAVINYSGHSAGNTQFAVVPEPSTLFLLAIGSIAIRATVRRRRLN